MRVFRLLALLPVLLLLSFNLRAEGWSGEAALGYLSSSGNSRTTSTSAKLAVDYKAEQWKNGFKASAINTSSNGVASAERYTVADQFDWSFDAHNYAFAALDYEKDLFGGIRERTSETLGYGRRLLTGPVHELEAEIGAGARQTERQTVAGVPGERNNEFIGRVSTAYRWALSETSAFAQSLRMESGESNTYSESVSELKLSVVGDLFAAFSYTIKHNSDVPADTQKTDTYSTVSLSYVFGDR